MRGGLTRHYNTWVPRKPEEGLRGNANLPKKITHSHKHKASRLTVLPSDIPRQQQQLRGLLLLLLLLFLQHVRSESRRSIEARRLHRQVTVEKSETFFFSFKKEVKSS